MHNSYTYVYVYSITKTFGLFPQSKKVLNLTQTPLQEVIGYYQMLGFSRNIHIKVHASDEELSNKSEVNPCLSSGHVTNGQFSFNMVACDFQMMQQTKETKGR